MKLNYLVVSIAISLSLPVHAEKVMYACQYIKSAGLAWKNYEWVPSGFHNPKPFFLTAEKRQLSEYSVAKALDILNLPVRCLTLSDVYQSCSSPAGNTLIFNHDTLNGGVSTILGATLPDTNASKDTLSVSSFTCTKM